MTEIKDAAAFADSNRFISKQLEIAICFENVLDLVSRLYKGIAVKRDTVEVKTAKSKQQRTKGDLRVRYFYDYEG